MEAPQQPQETHSVFVSNISPQATEKTVSDFFSFCGKITQLYLKQDTKGEGCSAVVQFETESAAKTALLLSNALIVDRPINVQPFPLETPSEPAQSVLEEKPAHQSNITQREFSVPDEKRSKTSVVASILAAGYVLGSDAIDKAKEFDDKNNISLKAHVAVETIKGKVEEIDKKLGITTKVTQFTAQAQEKVNKINEDLKISEKTNQAATTIRTTVDKVGKDVSSNPTVAKGLSTLTSAANTISSSVSSVYQEYKEQTQKAIEEKMKVKEQERIRRASQGEKTLEAPKVSVEPSPAPSTSTVPSTSTDAPAPTNPSTN